MRNEKNLIPNSERTPEERRRNAAKAGRASGKARRARKTLRENMELLLSLPVNTKYQKALTTLGVDEEDADNAMLVTAALFKSAISGDVSAIKELRNLVGEDLQQYNTVLEDDPITKSLKEEFEK